MSGHCCILGRLERICDLGFTKEHNGAIGFVWNYEMLISAIQFEFGKKTLGMAGMKRV